MLRRLKDRVTYANVTATLALCIALGGTSYAAINLPRNSVGASELRKSSVRSAEVKDRALKVRDLSRKARRSLRGQRGPVGPQGPPGISGTGASLGLTYKTVQGTAQPESVASSSAVCDAGQRAIAGGMRVDTGSDTSLRESYPSTGNTAWTVRVGNDQRNATATYTVFAVCASG